VFEFRFWILEFGIWNLEFGIWNLEFGIQSYVPLEINVKGIINQELETGT